MENKIKLTPNQEGDHQISVLYKNQAISGSPFTLKAYQFSAKDFKIEGNVTTCQINQAHTFQAVSIVNDDRKQKADQGGETFDVQINGPSQIQVEK